KLCRIAFTGGGTGGHVYPALAVWERLRELIPPDVNLEVLWIGSRNGIEKDILIPYLQPSKEGSMEGSVEGSVEQRGLDYYGVSCGKLRRYFSLRNFSDLFRIAWGIAQSYQILRRKRPDLLFSKGGFVSVPAVIAAKILGIPVWAHESDLDPGLATRLVLPWVHKLFLPYEQSRKYYPSRFQGKLEVCGNPVRQEFFCHFYKQDRLCEENTPPFAECGLLPPRWFDTSGGLKKPLLLVLGGSLGAHELNMYVAEWLKSKGLGPFYILHQCGSEDYRDLCGDFATGGGELEQNETADYRVLPFIPRGLGKVYQLCRQSGGLVVSRAGAGSLWEILASGNRAILVPLQSGSRGDQVRNARFFAEQGWGDCFIVERTAGNQGNSQKLLEKICLILQDRELYLGKDIPDAALLIARKMWAQVR
ncbi:MAG: UDP-N-acetylglucosamine--N-acetylmuramyl-(pentapeptide) pyrophosphoryl-undecaprenol N-acetylglucosamine transferase, partial [Spirochaetota bacterium]